jgi:hypothetical protein
MRTIVLLGVVVGLLVVGKAHAECAWVLWDGTVGFANNVPPTDTSWTATAAFPTSESGYTQCLEAMHKAALAGQGMLGSMAGQPNVNPPVRTGAGEIVVSAKVKDVVLTKTWRCLRDTVKP